MVSRKEYEKRTEAQWKGVKVRTLCDMHNGIINIPKGTVCQIYGKSGGFSLETEPCKRCGVSIFIKKVAPRYVEVFG